MTVECAECHEELAPPPEETPEHRDPCPKCGSVVRAFSFKVSSGIFLATGSPTDCYSTTSPAGLLNKARKQLTDADYSAAAILANTACEVAVNLAAAGHPERTLKPKVRWSTRDDIVRQFETWTGVAFSTESFWPDYLRIYALRNGAAHEGRNLRIDEAQKAIETAAEFIRLFGF